jgi:glycosyltransferase involved in cell wall biosynthesis
MKICFASDYFPLYHKFWGGAEQATSRFQDLLNKKGHQTTLLFTKPQKQTKETSSTIKFFAIPVLEDYLPNRIALSIGKLKANLFPLDFFSYIYSYKALKKANPDILHLHNFHSLSFSLVLAAKQLHIPIVYSIYDYWCLCPLGTLVDCEKKACRKFHGPYCSRCIKCFGFQDMSELSVSFLSFWLMFRQKIFDFFLKKIDAFVVLSKSSSVILSEYGVHKERIFSVPLFLSKDIDDPIENPFSSEPDSILYVGWIHPRKGLHVLLEAMPLILEEIAGAKLYVIGESVDDCYMNKINAIIRKNNLHNKVFLMGKRSFQEVKQFFQKTSVMVIPEQWENMSPVILGESMYFGKAIVASNIGGIPEFVIDGENGLLAAPADSADFAKKIIHVLKDRQYMQKIGNNSKKTAQYLFSEEARYKRLLNLYQSLVDPS